MALVNEEIPRKKGLSGCKNTKIFQKIVKPEWIGQLWDEYDLKSALTQGPQSA